MQQVLNALEHLHAGRAVPTDMFLGGTLIFVWAHIFLIRLLLHVFSYDYIRRCSWSPPHQYQNGVGLVLAPRHRTRRMQVRLDLA